MRNMPYIIPKYSKVPKTYKALKEALSLISLAIQDERKDELFYDYLVSIAPTEEEKDIISTIRNDEKKHILMFINIYTSLTRQEITLPENTEFEEPESYIRGVKKALFSELTAVEKYRDIKAGLHGRYFRDIVFEILTDELKHADKYNYILNLDIERRLPDYTHLAKLEEEAKTYWELVNDSKRVLEDNK